MNDRTSSILAIRPKINNIDSNIDSKEIESFQNKVLRPLLKFQKSMQKQLTYQAIKKHDSPSYYRIIYH